MKLFHISDVLSVTTGRLVSSRGMDGIYDILNFLTGDSLFTHQLPRAMRECSPWLRTKFPQIMKDSPEMTKMLETLDKDLEATERDRDQFSRLIDEWVETVRASFGLPEQLPIYEMGADMHTHIDPIEELSAMMGDKKVMVVAADTTRSND